MYLVFSKRGFASFMLLFSCLFNKSYDLTMIDRSMFCNTAGNLLIHSILLCSLNVEENFLFRLRGVNNTASERYVCAVYV